ncbi:MAG: phosphohydrolase, partial [Methanosarcinales archaeon]|nr:phosphohydrolase [Methanosarcinales archaeon]
DRLDAMGAIGIARVFTVGGSLGRKMYDPHDPFCTAREPDDGRWNLDHFYRKLLKLGAGMHTGTARNMAGRREAVMREYLAQLQREIEGRG